MKKNRIKLKQTNESIYAISGIKKPCVICGQPTVYIEIYTEARFCSDACCRKWYRAYEKHLLAQR